MHPSYTLLMSLVLDEEATPEEEVLLRSHLRECNTCSATWARWQEIDRRFSVAPQVSAPAGLAEAVFARLEQTEAVRVQRRHGAAEFGLLLAVALVLLAGIALVVANWPIAMPAAAAALSGLLDAGEWILGAGALIVATAGVPAVAATAGALLCLTCCLAVAWLWIINQGVAQRRAPVAV